MHINLYCITFVGVMEVQYFKELNGSTWFSAKHAEKYGVMLTDAVLFIEYGKGLKPEITIVDLSGSIRDINPEHSDLFIDYDR